MSITRHTLQQDGNCVSCGEVVLRGNDVIKTPNLNGWAANKFFCFDCGREIAKIALANADLEEFGQELVMDKLNK